MIFVESLVIKNVEEYVRIRIEIYHESIIGLINSFLKQ